MAACEIQLRGKVVPGIKKNMLTSMRKLLMEYDGEAHTVYELSFYSGFGVNTVRKYMEYMVEHGEAGKIIVDKPRTQVTYYMSIS